jgi:hypothetical protein|tara:strand:+ start:12 stop:158 length:147 start_codon:yes stop_codon:yes gene_type:complete
VSYAQLDTLPVYQVKLRVKNVVREKQEQVVIHANQENTVGTTTMNLHV